MKARLWAPLAILVVATTLAGCLYFQLEGLPCQRDCHCPSGELCKDKKCVPAGEANRPGAGAKNGPCGAGDSCNTADLFCHTDSCGGKACRQVCNPKQGSSQCDDGQVCQALSPPDDGGFSLGADGGPAGPFGTTDGVCSP